MANDTKSANEGAFAERLCMVEQVFRALPPLGSPDYIEQISRAPTSELPPEVLARALRQLPPESAGFEATHARLLRRKGKKWEYFVPLMNRAERLSIGVHDHEDVLQEAFIRIIETLLTERGAFAERAWHTFCLHEASDVWRERFGRRGQKANKEVAGASGRTDDDGDGKGDSPGDVSGLKGLPQWHVALRKDKSERIEQMVQEVVESIPDEFVRKVATSAWCSDVPVKVSGTAKGDVLILTEVFPGKSRHQIQRALRQAKSQLAAALLADKDNDWSPAIHALLEYEKGGAPKKTERKEKNQ
jgi:DNA-directed RNA polymerase specialized sigma24 family protein